MKDKENDKINKILITLLIILVVFLCLYVFYICTKDRKTSQASTTNTSANEVLTEKNSIDNDVKDETDIENNIDIAKNDEENKTQNEQKVENTEKSAEDIVGKEEQESNKETGGINPDEKAINLAKEKWGQNSDAYIFKVDNVEGDIYHVSVVSNATIISYIDVNIKTGEVTEY